MAEQRIDDPVVHYTAIEDDAKWSCPSSDDLRLKAA